MCKTKKMLAVILALIMTFSMFAGIGFTANANESNVPTIIMSVDENSNSEQLVITVSAANVNITDVDDGDFVFTYDSQCLEYKKIKCERAKYEMTALAAPFPGTAVFSFANPQVLTDASEPLCELIFNVLKAEETEITCEIKYWGADLKPENTSIVVPIDAYNSNDDVNTSVVSMFKYEINNGEVTITDCDLDIAGDVIIPETIDGYPVTVIGEHAFSGCDRITSVVIPDSVRIIEQFAFSGSDGLLNATIGSGVTTLGRNIFWGCQNLENVIIEEGVTYISQEMFSQCKKLKSVSIPESVTTIGKKAFELCYLIENIELPDKLVTIEQSTFYMCHNLKSVIIPNTVTKIDNYAFYQCEKLETIKLSDNLKEIGNYTFAECGLKSLDIPYGVNSIGEYAFSDTKLKSVVIPGSVSVISNSVFRNCKNLSEVTIPKTVKIINAFAFCGCDRLANVVIPPTVTEVWGEAFGYEAGFTPKGITVYGVKGSAAQTYADINWYATFVELKESDFNFDVNADGDITAADARLALRASAALEKLSGLAALAADVDANGNITAADARKILRKSAGLK